MKAKKHFLAMLLFVSISGFAQIKTSNAQAIVVAPPQDPVLANTLNPVFSNLEKDRIPTGLLLDAAVEFANLKKYDGSIPDSSYTSSKLVVDVYNTLIMSRLSANAQLNKSTQDFVNEWKVSQQPDIIPLGGLFYKYSQFSSATQQNAQNTGDPGNVAIIDGKIWDRYIGKNNWVNPYEQKNVFVLSPAISSFNKYNFKIALPDNLFLSNQASQIQKIEYRLSDDSQYQILQQNQLINVNYTAEGTYRWTFKLTLQSGEILYSHTQFKVDGNLDKYTAVGSNARTTDLSQYTKVDIDPYSIPGPWPWSPAINKAKATLYIKLAPGHTQISNPLIIAEGFDMGSVIAPSREAGLTNIDNFRNSLVYNDKWGFSDYTLYSNLNGNYDIIYVDWGNGVDYIQNNADLLKKAIRWVNSNKIGTNKSVVLGQSMGGLIARFALKDMEDNGENHNAKLFISHDSPHLGANIPLGIQYMLVNVSNAYVKAPLISGALEFVVPIFNQGISVGDVLTLTDTPAARQMLINYVNKNYQIDNTIHNNWQNELKTKGYPALTRNVAISNGSECGTDQNIQDLLSLYKETGQQHLFSDILGTLVGVFTLRLDMVLLASLPGSSKYVFDFNSRPMLNLNENKQIYRGNIKYKKKILWAIDAQVSLLSGSRNQPANVLPVDKYGGGKFILAQGELPDFIANNVQMTPFSFIPTPSALDYKYGNSPLTESDYQKSYSPSIDSERPFSNFAAEKIDTNNTHISFSSRNSEFIINQFSTYTQDNYSSTAYLCGSKVQIGGNTIICDNTKNTYTTGFAPIIQWSVLTGAGLIDINGPTNQPQLSFTPKAYANGAVKLQVYLADSDASNTVTKDIWIGKPKVKIPNGSCGNPDDTVCFNNGYYPLNQTFQQVIQGVGMETNQNLILDYEWEIVTGNSTFVNSTPGSNGRKFTGNLATILAKDVSIQVRGRAKNNCGWGVWKTIFFNNYGGRSNDSSLFNVYPNPSDDHINISLLDEKNKPQNSNIELELYDKMGRKQRSGKLKENKGKILVKGLTQGTYTLKIMYDGKSESQQVIVK